MAAIVVGVCIVLWTVFFIHNRRPVVYLALSILLVAVGGGIAHIPFFLIGWAVSTRINSPLTWWKRAMPKCLALRLARAWLAILIVDYALLFAGIAIWLVFLPPGSTNRSRILQYTCWCLIAAGLLMQLPTIVSGFIRDLQRRVTTNEQST